MVIWRINIYSKHKLMYAWLQIITFTAMADLPGLAILDYQNNDTKHKLWIHNRLGKKENMPVNIYFRNSSDMPKLETLALKECKGSVLDIGAAAGSHALWLQEKGHKVTALDISPAACEVMRARGVADVRQEDIFTLKTKKFNTVLLLMNGIGLTSNLTTLKKFLLQAKKLITPKGQLIFDSSDVMYLYEEQEMPFDKYYGEIEFRYEYKKMKTDWFHWLYVDQQTLGGIALETGWKTEILFVDEFDQYLAKLTLL